MALRDIFRITRQTRILLIFLVCISASGLLIAYLYYNSKNKSEDPRIIGARLKLVEFDHLMKGHNYMEALQILDTVNTIYENTTGYQGSFEFGVIFNNRCSVYLSMALYDSLKPEEEKESLLRLAEKNVQKSISIYTVWLGSAGKLTKDQIKKYITPRFNENDPGLKGKNIGRLIGKRVEDIVFAQTETPRRLSVSYTNLGIIQRHQYRQEEAAQSYIKAISLWKDNFTARNNFNVLMGLPPEDRSIIEKLFPPERLNTK
jgi:hypothetical protein